MHTLTLPRISALDVESSSNSTSEPVSFSARHGDYRIKIFRGPTGLKLLSTDWDDLVSRMSGGHFWHQREWFEAYVYTLAPNPENVVFCAIYDSSDTVIAILPLQEESRTIAGPIKVRTLELPRHDHLHLRDILIADDVRARLSLTTIVNLLKQSRDLKWDILALWHALDDSSVMTATRLESPCASVSVPRFHCSYLDLGSWDEISQRLSKSFRQNLRTANNRATKLGGITIESFSRTADLTTALEQFIEVEASGWKGAAGTATAIKLDAKLTDFYRQLIARFGPSNQCEIHLLKHNGKAIGGLFLLLTDQRLYVPKVAYDEEHHRLSPVQLLLEHAFKHCAKHHPRIKQLNLTSDAGWFDTWQPIKSTVGNVYVFNSTPMGLTAGAAMKLHRWIKSH